MFDVKQIRLGMRVIGSNGAAIGTVYRVARDEIVVAAGPNGGRTCGIPFHRICRIDRVVHLSPSAGVNAARRRGLWIGLMAAAGVLTSITTWHAVKQGDTPAASAIETTRHVSPISNVETVPLPNNERIALARNSAAYAVQRYLSSDEAAPRSFALEHPRFGRGEAIIDANEQKTLQALATVLKAYPDAHGKIVASGDAGASDGAARLAERRAVAVLTALGAAGVAPGHLEAGPGAQGPAGKPAELIIIAK